MIVPHSHNDSNRESATAESRCLECAVAAFATIRMTFEEVNALRKKSDSLPGNLGNSLLRHADEQTLAALAAARDTVARMECPPQEFGDWGVVCSTRYLGRKAFAESLTKFAAEGPWNVSVQVVPNRSLHSPGSMVGLALGCHGPCIGVGGGLDGETDAWITAMTLLDQHAMPGMFMIFSGWEPDEHIDVEGKPLTDSRCTSLVLALQPSTAKSSVARLKIGFDANQPTSLEVPAKRTAISLFEEFAASNDTPLTAILGGGLCAEMDWTPAVTTKLPIPIPEIAAQKKAA